MVLKISKPIHIPYQYHHYPDFSFTWSEFKWRFSRRGWIKWDRTWGKRRLSTLLNFGSSEIIWAFSSTTYNTTCRFDDLYDVDDAHFHVWMAYPRLNSNPFFDWPGHFRPLFDRLIERSDPFFVSSALWSLPIIPDSSPNPALLNSNLVHCLIG